MNSCINQTNWPVHPAAELFPMLGDDDLRELANDIKANGQVEPIILFDGQLLDGRNRLAACKLAGVEPKTRTIHRCESPTQFVLSLNLRRRHLNAAQKTVVAVEALPLFETEAKARQVEAARVGGEESGRVRRGEGEGQSVPTLQPRPQDDSNRATHQAAKAAGAGIQATKTLSAVAKKAPEVFAAVKSGKIESVADARRLSNMAPEKRENVLAKLHAPAADHKAKSVVAEAAREERVEKLVEISKGNASLKTAQRYPVIYVDPPWRYEHVETESRAIENQYPTMTHDEICAMPVKDIATPDAVMFMWATSPKLAEAMDVLKAWGFSYRTCAVWAKDKIGMGYYFRQAHELLLIATKGAPPTPLPSDRPSSVVTAPRTRHSAKPVEFYEIIEKMYPTLPKVELFCRSPRDGWSVWGNQSNG